jgi:uncharacterized protein
MNLRRDLGVEERNGTDQGNEAWEAPAAGDIFVDAEGDWFYQGNKIIREDILAFFYDHLECAADNSYSVAWEGQRCDLKVDDTPFVITRVDRVSSPEGGRDLFSLAIKHVSPPEILDPESLWVGKDNVLYGRVRSARFPARFSRPAYYQMAEWIQENPVTGEFFLEINDERYPVQFRE